MKKVGKALWPWNIEQFSSIVWSWFSMGRLLSLQSSTFRPFEKVSAQLSPHWNIFHWFNVILLVLMRFYPLNFDIFLNALEGWLAGGPGWWEDDQSANYTKLQQLPAGWSGQLCLRSAVHTAAAHSCCNMLPAAVLQAASCIGPAAAVQPALHRSWEDWKLNRVCWTCRWTSWWGLRRWPSYLWPRR